MLTSKTQWCMLKISGQIFRRNKDICIASKYLHQTTAMVVLTYVQKFFGTPPSWMWAGLSDSIPKSRLWKGRNSDFTLEKTDRHQLNRGVKVKSPVISHFDVMYPADMVWQEGHCFLHSLVFVTPDYSWENIGQTKIQGHSTKYLTSKKYQGHINQGKPKNSH